VADTLDDMALETNSTTVIVEQSLHGYRDGHSLLAASFTVPPDIDRFVLCMSDMSGPSMIDGFRSYLTGYPMPSSALYAIARTWYAHEMERPGCVWTHTLFFPAEVLGRLDAHSLVACFQRPTDRSSWQHYTSKVRIRCSKITSSLALFDSSLLGAQVLSALYSNATASVYVIADSAQEFETLVLAVWNQQWASLRASFRFCTGSLGDRKWNGQSFDLQVVPVRRAAQLRRECPSGTFVGARESRMAEVQPWAEALARELDFGGVGAVSNFLKECAEEFGSERTRVAPLLELKLIGTQGSLRSVDYLLKAIWERFPSQCEARRAKKALLDDFFNSTGSVVPALRVMALTQFHSAFVPEDFSIERRVLCLMKQERSEAASLIRFLADSDLNPLGEVCLTSMCAVLSPSQAVDCCEGRPGLMLLLVGRNPSLAKSPEIWRASNGRERDLLNVVRGSISDPDSIDSVTRAMLDADCSGAASDVFLYFGNRAAKTVLDWANDERIKRLGEAWTQQLRNYPRGITDWLREVDDASVDTLELVATVLNPCASELSKVPGRIWLPLARRFRHSQVELSVMTFLLALSFVHGGSDAPQLVAAAFPVVYRAAESDRLGYDNWSVIKELLPTVPWWRDWDKCERLRRGIVESFLAHRWPVDYLLEAMPNRDTLRRVLKYCRKHPSAMHLTEGILDSSVIETDDEGDDDNG
jgi:hypothetical protein